MFGHRSDGRKLKTVPPFFRVIPCVMLERNYAQVYFKQDIKLKELDEYIDRKSQRRNKAFLHEYNLCSYSKNHC